jgi:ABC-2 type transport system permease protein
MRLFWELAWRACERHLAYRVAALAGLATNFFFGLLRAAVIVALYSGRDEIAGFNILQAVTFTGLSQALIGVMSFFGWYDLINNVYTGNISSDLLKPMNLFTYWLAQDAGRALVSLFLRGLPIMIAYGFLLGAKTPNTFFHWFAICFTLVLSWIVSFNYRFILNLASFWTPNALGIARFGFMLTWFLSGFMFPLRYFPNWFVSFCQLTPFPYMVNTTIEIYLGVIEGWEIVFALILQGVWAVGMFLVGQFILRKGISRLVIVGG